MPDETPALAARACLACRKQKRKCTRELPECSLCEKHGRACDYDISDHLTAHPIRPAAVAGTDSPSDASAYALSLREPSSFSQSTATEPALAQNGQNVFPALFFLDHEYYQQLRYDPWKANLSLPLGMSHGARSQTQMTYDADIYFTSVHTYFPIDLSNAKDAPNADLSLLMIAMRLHIQPADNGESPGPSIYDIAKACASCSAHLVEAIGRLLARTLARMTISP
ncbi:hypothetical protein G7Z17_g1697 [Cylindrodendrum hubeiense]|uniref:Zn(2)-C6 fungal-type domain-containing protein n=1 Tax=Cylindrodendrum hubeiense TaxID=595255 RepID=A0A9P5HMC2_9HYPO|nr:hypothetical protein G7Z17_g1697 [Cylindrodendrum hubeiense]